MSAEAKSKAIEGLGTVTSTPLPVFRALDLVPEIAGLMEGGSEIAMIKALSGGKLRTLLPAVLAGTKVTVTEGGQPVKVSLTDVESINLAFDGRMGCLPEVVAFALEVSFRDFFEGLKRLGERVRSKAPV